MARIRLRFAATLVLVVLVACGGGGGGSTGGGSGASPGTGGSLGTPAAPIPGLPTLVTASAIVDVDADGRNDVILGSQDGTDASPIVLLNDGAQSFTKSTTAIAAQYKGVNGAAVVIEHADFDNDGRVDLLVAAVDATPGPTTFYQSAQIHLFKGNGDGTFTDASANITSGTLPFAVSCGVFSGTDFWPENLRVADLDGDGALDFVIASSGNGCGGVVYRNDGSGRFAPVSLAVRSGATVSSVPSLVWPGNYATEVVIGDLNNDGKPDLFAPSSTGSTHAAFINTSTAGNLSFTLVTTPTKPSIAGVDQLKNAVLLDINGDGNLDVVGSLAISGSTATVPVHALVGTGTGAFTQDDALLSPLPAVVHLRQILAADLSGDGRQDVLISDHGFDAGTFPGARNWLLINNGTGKLVDRTGTNLDLLPGYTHQSSIGDLDGDGAPDLLLNNLVCNGTTTTCANQARFWRNNGSGAFTAFTPAIK
jgi:hypothetical protein